MNTTFSFAEISSYPKNFSTGSVLARVIDGLGFRYYWATEGLTENDLLYSPGNNNRTTYQTLNHLYNMVDFMGNILENKTYHFPEPENGFDFSELRQKTLHRMEEIRNNLSDMENGDLEEKTIHLTVGGNPMDFSIWHMFNGPFTDSIFHIGQIISFRRANGNPVDPYVEPFFCKRIEK